MKHLLISGDTAIACYGIDKNGSARLLLEKPSVRTTFCVPRKNGIFTVYEGEACSALVRMNRNLEETDRVNIDGTLLCHLHYAENTKTLYGSCYGNGEVIALAADDNGFGQIRCDEVVGQNAPGTPRAHCSITSPDGRFLLTAAIDQDRIYLWQLAADGSFAPNPAMAFCPVPKGSGPRHLRFHPHGGTLYAVTEYSNEVFTFSYDAENGTLQLRQAVATLPTTFQGESFGSALLIPADGTRLYAANRGADTIALFTVAADKTLRPYAQYSCGGHWPRHMEFTTDETMIAVANERSCEVTLHRIDHATGALCVIGRIPFDRPGFAAEWDEF